jgi:hypothetical protein
MHSLPVDQLARACRSFLALSYPDGEGTIPAARRPFLHLAAGQPLEPLLTAPLCETLAGPDGGVRSYAFRLGSAAYPHLKLQVTDCDSNGTWVFTVDTHDVLRLPPGHPDATRLAELQAINRMLKQQIESAWEAEGLLTFNGLLRYELHRPRGAIPMHPRPED